MNETKQGILALLKSAVTQQPQPLPEGFDIEAAEPLIRSHHSVLWVCCILQQTLFSQNQWQLLRPCAIIIKDSILSPKGLKTMIKILFICHGRIYRA